MKIAFPPIVDPKSRILILGTMPGEKSLEIQQYYGNRQNQFWRLLFGVFDEPFIDDYSLRIKFLHRKHIALWDVLAACVREGSLDSNIKDALVNDFNSFYEQHPQIKKVYFSSKVAANLYNRANCPTDGLTFHTLPSPSGAYASKSFAEKLTIWKDLFAS